jgi:hypothetical protein
MPLPRARFTVSRMMVCVGAVALMVAAWRQAIYSKAAYHAEQEARFLHWAEDRAYAYSHTLDLGLLESPRGVRQQIHALYLLHMKKAAYHASLKEKYHRAVFLPWLIFSADPPEP